MNTSTTNPQIFDFCFPELDTLVQVEAADGAVVIRASRDTFSEIRRQRFIRELAAEGFIPDQYQWLGSAAPGIAGGVRWLVDASCFQPGPTRIAETRRFMFRLLGAGGLLWLLLISMLVARHV
ncbi:MAG TPA: hypothetical protein VLW52_08945 [Opitutaceae bacterium]|nr:hypothetical protein [Opitutaceae bacterium]